MRCRGVGTVLIIILFKLELDEAQIGLPPLSGGKKEDANSHPRLEYEQIVLRIHA